MIQEAIRRQFGAAIDALEDAIRVCPDHVWTAGDNWHQPWYLAYHTIFWLDLHISESPLDYEPPEPFTCGELDPDAFPERPCTKDELMPWIRRCREALETRLLAITTEEEGKRLCRLHCGEMETDELLLSNLRHVQHHAAQINLLIRQTGCEPVPWRIRAGS